MPRICLKIVLFLQRQHVPIFISSSKELVKTITCNNWASQGKWSIRHQILTILVENNMQKTRRILHFSTHCWNISPKHRWHSHNEWQTSYCVEYSSTDIKMYQKTILFNVFILERGRNILTNVRTSCYGIPAISVSLSPFKLVCSKRLH